ncbi:MAG: pseudouridine synthase [Rhodothermales bacterium]
MVLPVLYHDAHYVAIDKPSGLLVHRTYLDQRERRFALQCLRDQLGRLVYPIHRLDKPASGVLLFALHPEAAQRMTSAFAEKAVEKRYLAIVRGHPDDAGVIDHPLKALRDKRFESPVAAGTPPAPALTRYRTLARSECPFAISKYPTSRYALVEAETETGRYHQVRRHFNHIHHPLIGDQKHGDYRHNRFFREQLGCDRLLLHAAWMRVAHPFEERTIEVAAPMPADFAAIASRIGLIA